MELATQPLSDKTNTVIIVPVMDNGIKYMLLVNPLDSRLQPELVGVWNSLFVSGQWSVVRCRIIRTRAYLPSVPCRTAEGVSRRSRPPRQDVGGGEPDGPGAGSPRAGSPWLWTSVPVGARTMQKIGRASCR